MMTTSTVGCATRRVLRVIAIPTAMLSLTLLLTACGDKEAPIEPTHQVQLAEARAATEREKSLRHVAEDRFGKLLVASVLAVGVALLLGVAIGSSSRRKTEGTDLEGAKTDV